MCGLCVAKRQRAHGRASVYFIGALEGVGDDALKLLADVLTEEIAEVEDGRIVFLGEPRSALPFLGASDVARIAAWGLASYAIVLP